MGATARVVLDPESVILDVGGVLLGDLHINEFEFGHWHSVRSAYPYLIHVKNFTSGLLHLAHLMHEVPEARLGTHFIWGEQLHSVSGRVGISGCGCLSTNHLVQFNSCSHLYCLSLKQSLPSLMKNTSHSKTRPPSIIHSLPLLLAGFAPGEFPTKGNESWSRSLLDCTNVFNRAQ